jgi:hypothetical protein
VNQNADQLNFRRVPLQRNEERKEGTRYIPPQNVEPSPTSRHQTLNEKGFSQGLYGGAQISLFGPQYGIPVQANGNTLPDQTKTINSGAEVSDTYDDMLRRADSSIQSSYADTQKSSRCRVEKDVAKPLPTSCLICTEEFRGTVVPPAWITVACLHGPSVCTECLAECIKSDLENKIWNQIKCPECESLLIHEDIERLADPATFSRYVQLEFMRTKRFKLRSE